jgi:hypothetical protein
MVLRRVPYGFRMTLPAPRAWAFRWATDYRSTDFEVLGWPAHRKVQRLADDLYLLTDSFGNDPFAASSGRRAVKEKLVHLYPESCSWTSTHLSGPNRGSQFLYELRPGGPGTSRFRYTGAQVESARGPVTRAAIARRARALRAEDMRGWRSLARAMRTEYRPGREN